MTLPQIVHVRQFGLQAYQPALCAMHNFTRQRTTGTADEIWLLEHPPVFTQGQAGKAEHILAPADIPVVQSDRGGQVTYHGPGQQILYILLDLRRYQINVRQLVSLLEQTVINTLQELAIDAHARPDAPGVYIANKKICSLGLRIRRGCSLHGLALNVAMDLSPFSRINPCGYSGLPMTQVSDYYPNATTEFLAKQLVAHLIMLLGAASGQKVATLWHSLATFSESGGLSPRSV